MTAGGDSRVALSGFGSVGKGLARILADRPQLPITITLVVDRGGFAYDPAGLDPVSLLEAKKQGSVAVHESGQSGQLDMSLLNRATADVLAEAASTSFTDGEPGWSYVKAAFDGSLDVVLASKGPVIAHWDELYARAKQSASKVGIAATHGAPVPALELPRVALAGNDLRSVHALLNSTTGVILETVEGGATLEEGIAKAQADGVAETDPTLDIEGFDAAAKCVILGRKLFGARLELGDVNRQGITGLDAADVQEAARAGTPIRLVSDITVSGEGVSATVRPLRLPADDPLCSLRNGALGVVYDADPVGKMFVSAYAIGGIATAAAMIRDILSFR
jgi:homoserine dehydrogenase